MAIPQYGCSERTVADIGQYGFMDLWIYNTDLQYGFLNFK